MSAATQPAPAAWVGWLRRLGPPNTSRAWRAVAEASKLPDCPALENGPPVRRKPARRLQVVSGRDDAA
jgi:hypothetical protein